MDVRFVYVLAVLRFVQCELVNLNCKAKKKFVDGHNSRRELIADGKLKGQPASSKMNLFVWNEELAAKAADWASKNNYQHNPDNSIPSGKFTTGENIYQYGTTECDYQFDLDMALKDWFDEYKDYQFKTLEFTDFVSGPQIGHYTQMAWADSIYVGCAISKYRENHMNVFFVVCNYGPSGNIIGRTPYKSGTAVGHLSCGAGDCSRRYGDSC